MKIVTAVAGLGLIGLAFAQSNAGPYYGLPLGAFHFNGDKTSAEVYAADPHNVVLVNFKHHPKSPGCTTLMAGPLPPNTPSRFIAPNNVNAILVPFPNPVRRRRKRNGGLGSPFFQWPGNFFELDNLRVSQPARTSSSHNQDPFEAIELDLEGEDEQTTQTTIAAVAATNNRYPYHRRTTASTIKNVPTSKSTAAQKATERIRPTLVLLHGDGDSTAVSSTTTTTQSTTTTTTAKETVAERNTIVPSLFRRLPTRPTTERRPVAKTQIALSRSRAQHNRRQQHSRQLSGIILRTRSTEQTTKTVPTTVTTPRTRETETTAKVTTTTRAPTEPSHNGNGVTKSSGGGLLLGNHRAPPSVHKSFFGPLPRLHEVQRIESGGDELQNSVSDVNEEETTVTKPTTTTTTAVFADRIGPYGGYTALLGRPRPKTVRPTTIRPPVPGSRSRFGGVIFRLGGDSTGDNGENDVLLPVNRRLETHHKRITQTVTTPTSTEQTTVETSPSSTPNGRGWWIVEDPRAELRKLRGPRPTLPIEFYRRSTTLPNFPSAPTVSQKFVLAESSGDTPMLVTIPYGFKIDEFQWFGIWDHCEGRRTAFVSTSGVTAPEEVVVDGIAGWAHNVKSSAIHLLNCNTLLIKDFQYTGADAAETFFYVGIGEFPQYIVHQERANVVGVVPDQPLRNYRREDVMVRLPKGQKTFDINFVSVYNPTERVSYGHAVVPPVIVPPCEDLSPERQ